MDIPNYFIINKTPSVYKGIHQKNQLFLQFLPPVPQFSCLISCKTDNPLPLPHRNMGNIRLPSPLSFRFPAPPCRQSAPARGLFSSLPPQYQIPNSDFHPLHYENCNIATSLPLQQRMLFMVFHPFSMRLIQYRKFHKEGRSHIFRTFDTDTAAQGGYRRMYHIQADASARKHRRTRPCGKAGA